MKKKKKKWKNYEEFFVCLLLKWKFCLRSFPCYGCCTTSHSPVPVFLYTYQGPVRTGPNRIEFTQFPNSSCCSCLANNRINNFFVFFTVIIMLLLVVGYICVLGPQTFSTLLLLLLLSPPMVLWFLSDQRTMWTMFHSFNANLLLTLFVTNNIIIIITSYHLSVVFRDQQHWEMNNPRNNLRIQNNLFFLKKHKKKF